MKAKDIKDLTDKELEEKLNEARTELFNLRFQMATGQLDNPLKIREARRNIARIQTVRREKQPEGKRRKD